MFGGKNKEKSFFWLDLIFFVILVLVGLYFFWKSNAPVVHAPEESIEDVNNKVAKDLPTGVEVIDLDNGNRLVKNPVEGYEVEVDEKYNIEKTIDDNVSLSIYSNSLNRNEGLFDNRVVFSSKKGNLDNLKQNVKKKCQNDIECTDFFVGEIIKNNIKWYKVVYFGEYVGAGWPEFLTEKDGTIYSLYFQYFDDVSIDNILQNFHF